MDYGGTGILLYPEVLIPKIKLQHDTDSTLEDLAGENTNIILHNLWSSSLVVMAQVYQTKHPGSNAEGGGKTA